jgi:hypothetical protein
MNKLIIAVLNIVTAHAHPSVRCTCVPRFCSRSGIVRASARMIVSK